MRKLVIPLVLSLSVIACGGVQAEIPTAPARDAALIATGQALEKLNRAELAASVIEANLSRLSAEAQLAIREPLGTFKAAVQRAKALLPTVEEEVDRIYGVLGPVVDLKAKLREVLATHAPQLVPWLELIAGL